MLSSDSVRTTINKYSDMLYRLCIVMLKNYTDAEDIVQETFIIYTMKSPEFDNEEHKKAWLLTVAANKCKNVKRYRARHSYLSLSEISDYCDSPVNTGIIEMLMQLPEKYRSVLTLHYLEDLKVKDIAEIIGKTPSAVKMRLQKGRRLLEEKFRKELL